MGFASRKNEKYCKSILINCAGSTSYIGLGNEMMDHISFNELQNDITLNLTSSLWITNLFTKYFSGTNSDDCTIVNISSLCAVQPFKTMAVYCATKVISIKHCLIVFNVFGS